MRHEEQSALIARNLDFVKSGLSQVKSATGKQVAQNRSTKDIVLQGINSRKNTGFFMLDNEMGDYKVFHRHDSKVHKFFDKTTHQDVIAKYVSDKITTDGGFLSVGNSFIPVEVENTTIRIGRTPATQPTTQIGEKLVQAMETAKSEPTKPVETTAEKKVETTAPVENKRYSNAGGLLKDLIINALHDLKPIADRRGVENQGIKAWLIGEKVLEQNPTYIPSKSFATAVNRSLAKLLAEGKVVKPQHGEYLLANGVGKVKDIPTATPTLDMEKVLNPTAIQSERIDETLADSVFQGSIESDGGELTTTTDQTTDNVAENDVEKTDVQKCMEVISKQEREIKANKERIAYLEKQVKDKNTLNEIFARYNVS